MPSSKRRECYQFSLGRARRGQGKLAATGKDSGRPWLNFLLFHSSVIPKPRVFSGGARACPERAERMRGKSNGDLARSVFEWSKRTAAGRIAKQGMIGDNLAK